MFSVSTRSTGRDYGRAVGVVFAVGAAFAYGVTVVIGRKLASAGLGSSESLGIRFSLAAIALFALVLITRRPLLPPSGERLAAVLLGTVGYAIQATLFYLGLAQGTAGAVALLFYAYPAMVTIGERALARKLPSGRDALAVALSVGGTAVVVVAGGRVQITTAGILFSLAAGAMFAAYLLGGERFLRKTDSLTSAAWVAGGAAVSLLVRAVLTGGVAVPSGTWPRLVLYGLSTAAAFTLMFAALRRIGPTRTAIALTMEAVFSVALAAMFLSERVHPLAAFGGVAILAGAIVASLSAEVADTEVGTFKAD